MPFESQPPICAGGWEPKWIDNRGSSGYLDL